MGLSRVILPTDHQNLNPDQRKRFRSPHRHNFTRKPQSSYILPSLEFYIGLLVTQSKEQNLFESKSLLSSPDIHR